MGSGLAELNAFLAARPSVFARLAVFGFDAFAVRAVIVIVVYISMLWSFFERLGVIGIDLSHLFSPVRVLTDQYDAG